MYEAFAWFSRTIISPICKALYKIILKPIFYVFGKVFSFFYKILGGLYDFFAEIAASIFLSPYEYELRKKEQRRNKEREQMEREAKNIRDQRKMKSSQGQQLPSSFVSAPPMLKPSSPSHQKNNSNVNPSPQLYPNDNNNNNASNAQLQNGNDAIWICPNCGEKVGLLFIDHHERICRNRA